MGIFGLFDVATRPGFGQPTQSRERDIHSHPLVRAHLAVSRREKTDKHCQGLRLLIFLSDRLLYNLICRCLQSMLSSSP